MNIRVERTVFSEFSTIGRLLVDGEFQCFTLEPVWVESENIKPRAIPQGTYTLKRRFSPKHGFTVPWVCDVTGFEDVEIHPGNFPKDTLACLLVGKTKGPNPDYIGASKLAFAELMDKLNPVWDSERNIDITYVNKLAAAGGASS